MRRSKMSVTTGQAIECFHFRLKLCADSYNHAVARGYLKAATSHKRNMEIHQIAIAALQEKAERENPQPLTLNELRQMMGEPVWCTYEGGAGWFIVGESLFTIINGITAYRQKPEEVEL